jgi:hypothetical protein
MAEWRIRGYGLDTWLWFHLAWWPWLRTQALHCYHRLWLAYYYRESEHDRWTRVG